MKYDTDKKGVSKEKLIEMMEKLLKDECIIGKIPNLTENECSMLFDAWETSEDGLITWY